MSDEKLLPCPFCGERLKFHSPHYGDDYYRHSHDGECPLGGDSMRDPLIVFDHPERIAAWNRHDPARRAILADRERSAGEVEKLSAELAEARREIERLATIVAAEERPERMQ